MKTTTIHGLPVLTREQAIALRFKSITTGIHAVTEKTILSGVAERRNPERACFIMTLHPQVFELAIHRGDIMTGD
jgi:hypothetical protein